MPVAWAFFTSFQQNSDVAGHLSIVLEPKVNEYLSLVMRLVLVFGFCFELPVLIMLLVRSNLVSVKDLRHKRRYAILIAFILAAILTPPDPVSQIALALPMILLYELSILGSLLFIKK
jgi:sec-independent protein translocase protein TatC